MAELLCRGYQAFRADRGNPAFDIAVDSNGSTSMIRVKTTTCNDVQWNAKKDGRVFLELRDDRDFVAIVEMQNGVRSAVIYLVPTKLVEETLECCHQAYISHAKRDGTPRKVVSQRVIRMEGEDKPTNPSFGFARKWEQFREAWHLLDS
ncbi:MAG: hypothetical protein R3B46_10195 [Phycisphaerales bacterium]|nr:hypothetical protein [Phycisphaerales bacterium]